MSDPIQELIEEWCKRPLLFRYQGVCAMELEIAYRKMWEVKPPRTIGELLAKHLGPEEVAPRTAMSKSIADQIENGGQSLPGGN